MQAIIRSFLLTLGFIFLLILFGVAYIWFSNTWQVQTLAKRWFNTATPAANEVPSVVEDKGIESATKSDSSIDGSAAPATAQTEVMAEAGVDESFFTSLSDAEVQCFRDRLGSGRVDEIIAGAVPSATEIITGMQCVE